MIRFIEVTKKHIANGDRGCSSGCAVARALRREYDPTWSEDNQLEIEVELEYGEPILWVEHKQLEINIDQCAFVKKFINNFDNFEKVEPFTLKIREEVGI
jgi:hypothetical protein